MILGIDLSESNGSVDFNEMKQWGVNFAMLKIGDEKRGGCYKLDGCFKIYYEEAKRSGINVGVYISAGSERLNGSSEANAKWFIDYIETEGFIIDYPIALNVGEQPSEEKISTTAYVDNWCYYVRQRGYYPMFYGNSKTFEDIVYYEIIKKYALWISNYNESLKNSKQKFSIWQFADKWEGKYHANYAMYDIAYMIELDHLNHK